MFLEIFLPQTFYKIVPVKKILTKTNSFYVQRPASDTCGTKTSRSTF